MAVGILLDAFLVRGLPMPATVASLGRHAWWLSSTPPSGPGPSSVTASRVSVH